MAWKNTTIRAGSGGAAAPHFLAKGRMAVSGELSSRTPTGLEVGGQRTKGMRDSWLDRWFPCWSQVLKGRAEHSCEFSCEPRRPGHQGEWSCIAVPCLMPGASYPWQQLLKKHSLSRLCDTFFKKKKYIYLFIYLFIHSFIYFVDMSAL